jgi:hypothetical protein
LSGTLAYTPVFAPKFCALAIMSRQKRRAPLSFDWLPVQDDDDVPAPARDIRMRHTHLNLHESGGSSSRTSFIPAPASPAKQSVQPSYEDDFNWNDEPAPLEINTTNYPFLDPAYQHFLDINEPGPPRRKRTTEVCSLSNAICLILTRASAKDDPLRKWLPDRDLFLHEIIRLDGRGDRHTICRICHSADPTLRCEDCFGGEMFCRGCMVDLHACTPLHRIEVHTINVSCFRFLTD